MSKKPIPSKYWSYRFRIINGRKRYVKIRKVAGKVKIRFVKRR